MTTELEALVQQAGKELQDVIQAFVDPGVQLDKLQEIGEAARALWNLADRLPSMDKRALVVHVLAGALRETASEYFPLKEE